MKFSREINRLLIGLLLAFGLVTIASAYWAIVGPDTILKRDDNPRLVEAEASIVRGDILDRRGELLAASIQNPDGTVTRRYYYPETSSALGYFSLRYGVGGAEAAFDTILRGDDLERNLGTYVSRDLLHRPQAGSNVRLTFDLEVQQQVYRAFGGRTGAAVVMSVPDGAILALLSLPTYDPNTLDHDWDQLVGAAGKPFFNRVLQGSYQPGSTLQVPLMAAALLGRKPMDRPIEDAATSVTVADVTLTCAGQPPANTLTLPQSFAYACPHPFSELASELGWKEVLTNFDGFSLNQSPTLPGFVVGDALSLTPQPTGTAAPNDSLQAYALGQGALTVNPLGIALVTASVINAGNAPQPFVLIEIQRPGSEEWTPDQAFRPSIPMTTAQVAGRLEELLREAVADGAARMAARPGHDVGGHAALAYSGEGTQAWFTGFLRLDGEMGVVAVVVVENSSDTELASQIGGTALEAGISALRAD